MKKICMILCLTLIFVYVKSEDFVKNEKDGFSWILHIEDSVAEARDASGNVIIPADRRYSRISYEPTEIIEGRVFPSCFLVRDGTSSILHGICTRDGTEVLPPIFREINMDVYNGRIYYTVREINNLYGVYDEKRRIIVAPRYTESPYLYDSGHYKVGHDNRVSNYVDNYHRIQNLLDVAYEQGVNTDDLMQQAYQLEEKGSLKKAIDVLSKAIEQKPSSFAYYHRGLCYFKKKKWGDAQQDLRYVLFLDDATPDLMVKADSILARADAESLRQMQRLEAWSNALDAVNEGLSKLNTTNNSSSGYSSAPTSSGFSGVGYPGTVTPNSSNNNTSRGGSSTSPNVRTKRCTACAGDGKCRGSHKCHGTGKCNYCNGKGLTQVQGNTIKCAVCNGSGRCSFCNGTGRCSRCGGRGVM